MRPNRDRMLLWGTVLAFLALQALPYAYATISANSDLLFGGFLLNPIDGYSYLAKMRQGWEGSWQFTLPYSAETGDAVPIINIYYLFLGHLSRWLGAPPLVVFHGARLINSVLMLLMLYDFCVPLFETSRARRFAFLLVGLGSGFGWLAIAFGLFTPDFWVSEAFPFLAAYANPHFPLGLALQFYLLNHLQVDQRPHKFEQAKVVFAAALLSVLYPFGLAIAGAVMLGQLALHITRKLHTESLLLRIYLLALGGGPFVLYQLWIVYTHPVLSVWNAQNLTPTPPPLELLIAFSPSFLFALAGIVIAWQTKNNRFSTPILWMLIGLVIIYLPLNLQRRMISGLFVPIALLAFFALESLTQKWRRWVGLAAVLLILSLPTNLVMLLGGLNAAQTPEEPIYLYRSERSAFSWLEQNAPKDALVMASPSSGLLIPAYSHVRVFYGHPFETVKADEWKKIVSDFYSRPGDTESQLEALGVEFVLYGSREMTLGDLPALPSWQVVFEQGNTRILAPSQ